MTTTAPSPTPASTISERLADHVLGLRYDDIPAHVIDKTKDHLAHLLGSAFQGRELDGGRRAVQLAHELGGGGDCSIVGEQRKVHLLDAVFANTFLIACLGADDYLMPQGAHPGIVAQPAAWAFGEATRASGRDLLTALVVGYDVLGRLCDPALTWALETFRPATFVLEPFAAVATVSRLLGLSHEQTVRAFGHAGQVGRHRTEMGDATWLIHPLLARNSGMAALLARSGMPASSLVFEGESGVFRTFFDRDVPEFVTSGLATLGREFSIADAQAKRPPASGQDGIPRHPAVIPVELARHLADEHALDVSRVDTVDVMLPEERRVRETERDNALHGSEVDPTTRNASLSLRIASALIDGPIDPTRFERPPGADVLAMLNKIQLRYEPGRPLLYARVEVTTTDGHRYSVADDGDVHGPPLQGWADWLADSGRTILPAHQLTHLTDLIRNLEDVPDVSEVMACVVPEAQS